MTLSQNIDCEYTKEVVCPYCGIEFTDSYELVDAQDTDIQIECGDCGKTFIYITDCHITFSSRQVPCLNGESHDWHTPQKIYFDEDSEYHTCKCCGKFEIIVKEVVE
jgi:uncharacterized Zn finger protein